MITSPPRHPARYTDVLLPVFAELLQGSARILDPFGGTGKVFELAALLPGAQIEAIEIEPEWAAMHPKTMLGNALALLWLALVGNLSPTGDKLPTTCAESIKR